MSGIYIPGMEMPDNCTRCDYIGLNVAIGCPVMSGINGRAIDCPLIAVPDHGRLIDADAVDTSYSDPEVIETLNDAPTIIPADKDGADDV